LASLWQGFGKALVGGFGKSLARLWQGFGRRLWQGFGKALVGGFGKALARLWQGFGMSSNNLKHPVNVRPKKDLVCLRIT
jgi:hypothetical protein